MGAVSPVPRPRLFEQRGGTCFQVGPNVASVPVESEAE
jgi:hypothetical protein